LKHRDAIARKTTGRRQSNKGTYGKSKSKGVIAKEGHKIKKTKKLCPSATHPARQEAIRITVSLQSRAKFRARKKELPCNSYGPIEGEKRNNLGFAGSCVTLWLTTFKTLSQQQINRGLRALERKTSSTTNVETTKGGDT